MLLLWKRMVVPLLFVHPSKKMLQQFMPMRFVFAEAIKKNKRKPFIFKTHLVVFMPADVSKSVGCKFLFQIFKFFFFLNFDLY